MGDAGVGVGVGFAALLDWSIVRNATAPAPVRDDPPDMPRPDGRTLIIFGGYAIAFALVAFANLLELSSTVRFGLAVVALAGGAVAVGEATERRRRRSWRTGSSRRSNRPWPRSG